MKISNCIVTLVVALIGYSAWSWRDELNKRTGCEITYMYPQYQKVFLEGKGVESYYDLYVYADGSSAPGPKPNTTPALFIPGNAGSYKQGRSIASETERMFAREAGQPGASHITWYLVDTKDELYAFDGDLLERQARYVVQVLRHLTRIHNIGSSKVGSKNAAHSNSTLRHHQGVIIVGHSMGGVVGRAAMSYAAQDPELGPAVISLLLTLASPHQQPPLPSATSLHTFYSRLRHMPMPATPVVSLSGGCYDEQMGAMLTRLQGVVPSQFAFEADVTDIPGVWTAVSHNSIVWCNQLITRLANLLMDLARDSPHKFSTTPVDHRHFVMSRIHHYLSHRAIPLSLPLLEQQTEQNTPSQQSMQSPSSQNSSHSRDADRSDVHLIQLLQSDLRSGGGIRSGAVCTGANLAWYRQYGTAKDVRGSRLRLGPSDVKSIPRATGQLYTFKLPQQNGSSFTPGFTLLASALQPCSGFRLWAHAGSRLATTGSSKEATEIVSKSVKKSNQTGTQAAATGSGCDDQEGECTWTEESVGKDARAGGKPGLTGGSKGSRISGSSGNSRRFNSTGSVNNTAAAAAATTAAAGERLDGNARPKVDTEEGSEPLITKEMTEDMVLEALQNGFGGSDTSFVEFTHLASPLPALYPQGKVQTYRGSDIPRIMAGRNYMATAGHLLWVPPSSLRGFSHITLWIGDSSHASAFTLSAELSEDTHTGAELPLAWLRAPLTREPGGSAVMRLRLPSWLIFRQLFGIRVRELASPPSTGKTSGSGQCWHPAVLLRGTSGREVVEIDEDVASLDVCHEGSASSCRVTVVLDPKCSYAVDIVPYLNDFLPQVLLPNAGELWVICQALLLLMLAASCSGNAAAQKPASMPVALDSIISQPRTWLIVCASYATCFVIRSSVAPLPVLEYGILTLIAIPVILLVHFVSMLIRRLILAIITPVAAVLRLLRSGASQEGGTQVQKHSRSYKDHEHRSGQQSKGGAPLISPILLPIVWIGMMLAFVHPFLPLAWSAVIIAYGWCAETGARIEPAPPAVMPAQTEPKPARASLELPQSQTIELDHSLLTADGRLSSSPVSGFHHKYSLSELGPQSSPSSEMNAKVEGTSVRTVTKADHSLAAVVSSPAPASDLRSGSGATKQLSVAVASGSGVLRIQLWLLFVLSHALMHLPSLIARSHAIIVRLPSHPGGLRAAVRTTMMVIVGLTQELNPASRAVSSSTLAAELLGPCVRSISLLGFLPVLALAAWMCQMSVRKHSEKQAPKPLSSDQKQQASEKKPAVCKKIDFDQHQEPQQQQRQHHDASDCSTGTCSEQECCPSSRPLPCSEHEHCRSAACSEHAHVQCGVPVRRAVTGSGQPPGVSSSSAGSVYTKSSQRDPAHSNNRSKQSHLSIRQRLRPWYRNLPRHCAPLYQVTAGVLFTAAVLEFPVLSHWILPLVCTVGLIDAVAQ